MNSARLAALAYAATIVAAAAQTDSVNTPPVCIQTYALDHTEVVDSRTVLFVMKNGDKWKNALPEDCPDLKLYGFAYETPVDELCSNQQIIHIIRTGNVCRLGVFTRIPRPVSQP